MMLLYIILFIAVIGIGVLLFLLHDRNQKIAILTTSLKKLTRSFNELDEQAKLIVKTDLELNKAQEELDKRLNGLDALQKISRIISTTLDESEIFTRLQESPLNDLGYEKYAVFIESPSRPELRLHQGFEKEELSRLPEIFTQQDFLIQQIRDRQVISSANATKDLRQVLCEHFQVKHFVLTPVLAQKKLLGIVFAGNQSDAFNVTEGDEEIISIFSDQLGQTIANARLFEQVYRSSQDLEIKVQERTRQLTEALEDVKRISNLKSEFISAVSHELRTPLTSIKGYASLLIAGKIGEIPVAVKDRLEKINKHSDKLVQLINNLLDISRIESGKVEMHFAPHDLHQIVNSVHDLLTPQLKDKEIIFEKQIPENLPRVFVDLGQVERVFINLISNAIKFTRPQGTIRVEADLNEDRVLVKVSDTGIGISQDNCCKLFDEFYRVDNEINQNVQGSGLGLALVKHIIEAHKGDIWVESHEGQGTTFFFTLPSNQETLLSSTAEKKRSESA